MIRQVLLEIRVQNHGTRLNVKAKIKSFLLLHHVEIKSCKSVRKKITLHHASSKREIEFENLQLGIFLVDNDYLAE